MIKYKLYATLLFSGLTTGCFDIPKPPLLSQEYLNSPDRRHTAYRCVFESAMAFGSGHTRIYIAPSDRILDRENDNFLSFSHFAARITEWVNEDTVRVMAVTMTDPFPQNRKPGEIEYIRVGEAVVEVTYVKLSGAGGCNATLDSISVTDSGELKMVISKYDRIPCTDTVKTIIVNPIDVTLGSKNGMVTDVKIYTVDTCGYRNDVPRFCALPIFLIASDEIPAEPLRPLPVKWLMDIDSLAN